MAELADAQDLGSCEAIRVGSTPTTRTKKKGTTFVVSFFLVAVNDFHARGRQSRSCAGAF